MKRIARGNVDDLEYGDDVVAMDDFIYGEPINATCPADLNGDGQVDSNDEYIELYNVDDQAVDLGGWKLDDSAASAPPSA